MTQVIVNNNNKRVHGGKKRGWNLSKAILLGMALVALVRLLVLGSPGTVNDNFNSMMGAQQSQQQPQPQSQPTICFVTSNYGADSANLDPPTDVTELRQDYPELKFIIFTNLEDLPTPGWSKITRPHNTQHERYRRFITHSRYGKFLAWQEPLLLDLCGVIFYVDGNRLPKLRLDNGTSSVDTFRNMAREIVDSPDGILQAKHYRYAQETTGSVFLDEFSAIEKHRKDGTANIQAQKKWIMSQPDFDANAIILYNNGHFGYDLHNKRFQQVSQFFWDHYSLEEDSWRDQPLWAYSMHHFKMKPLLMTADEAARLFPKTRTNNFHRYTGDADTDALRWYASKGNSNSSSTRSYHSDQLRCIPLTSSQRDRLQTEIKDYEKSQRFLDKIQEVKGEIDIAAHHKSIKSYLESKVLDPDWSSVLELGCAAGMMLNVVHEWYKTSNRTAPADGSTNIMLVGVELVTGWVKSAQDYFPEVQKPIDVFEGDMTEFSLPEPYNGKTFDFVMLNDVLEHLDQNRYGCFFEQLKRVTHSGSVVYAHTPTPETQLVDAGQYFENTLPHHVLVAGMRQAGFELVTFEHDVDTVCPGGNQDQRKKMPRPLRGTQCMMGGWTKYTHGVFQRANDPRVFLLQ